MATKVYVQVDSPVLGFLRLRAQPTTNSEELAQIPHEAKLLSLEGSATQGKVDKMGQWLRVRTPEGEEGYVAAWYLCWPEEPVEEPPVDEPEEEGTYVEVDSPVLGFLRLRAEPTVDSQELAQIDHGARLLSLEDDTAAKVGKREQWLHVRTDDGIEGYVAAWYLCWPGEAGPVDAHQPTGPTGADTRRPATANDVRTGESHWIYGMHACSIDTDNVPIPDLGHSTLRPGIRAFLEGAGKKGWVLFTEALGLGHQTLQTNEKRKGDFWDWAANGYGVIIRLNHGYGEGGTLPRSSFYSDFAQTCARYAELYLKHPQSDPNDYTWVIVVANEMNNYREWPGGHSGEMITPELYAQAFNRVYSTIKRPDVLPNATVISGAVDPYNYDNRLQTTPLDYFQRMLAAIDKLDGFALHTYTHGHDTSFIKHDKTFGAEVLASHYYDFKAYQPFMERIPSKWRHLPVYITETNPLYKSGEGDWGWKNENIGWIQAAYAEINRWNNQPHAQQIQALMLYRWWEDAWEMQGKGELANDFRAASAHDYRWRT